MLEKREIQNSHFEKAEKFLTTNTKIVSDFEQFKSELEKGLFLNASWCGDEKCEEKIKEITGADIRVIPFNNKKSNDVCIWCKKPGKETVIFARGY